MFNSFLCSIEQRVPMLEVLECSASFDEEKEHLGHFSCWPLSLVHLWQFPSCCQGVQTCRWGASPPNVGCSPSIRRSTSPRAMKQCGRGETVMIWITRAVSMGILTTPNEENVVILMTTLSQTPQPCPTTRQAGLILAMVCFTIQVSLALVPSDLGKKIQLNAKWMGVGVPN